MSSIVVEDSIKNCLEINCNVNLQECENLCKSEGYSFGVAVSGGADSCCLLISLCNILKKYNIPIKVISVNHFIRPDEETCGDVDFVKQLCEKLKNQGYNLNFYAKELARGEVKSVADSRKMGIEEAARFLRYELFEDFIYNEKILYLCLAHNKNDFYETVLMRFLQGASCDSSSGISYVRNKYIRPLLNIEREDIELYLVQKGQSWRTDKTNFDISYYRNKIRNKLMPFLSDNFEGWQTAIEKGAAKAELDSDFITEYVENTAKKIIFYEANDSCYVDLNDLKKEKPAIQIRLLLKMCNGISENSRIPFVFLQDICNLYTARSAVVKMEKSSKLMWEKRYSDLVFFVKESKLYVKKVETNITDYCFSDIITNSGIYEYDWGRLEVLSDLNHPDQYVFELKYKSGKTDKITGSLPFQLIINHQ